MPKLTELQELAAAIRIASEEAEPSRRSHEVAAELYEANRELIASVADQWIIDKLSTLVSRHRLKIRRATDHQLVLEGMFGFTHLPKRLEVKPGKFVDRANFTISNYRKLATKFRQQEKPALEEAVRAIELMKPYTKRGGKKITWVEVLEKEATKAAKKH